METPVVSSATNISPSDVKDDDGSGSKTNEAEKQRLEKLRAELEKKLEECRAQHRSGPANGNHESKEADLRSQISTIDGQISRLD